MSYSSTISDLATDLVIELIVQVHPAHWLVLVHLPGLGVGEEVPLCQEDSPVNVLDGDTAGDPGLSLANPDLPEHPDSAGVVVGVLEGETQRGS